MLDVANAALKKLQDQKSNIDKSLAETVAIAGTFTPDVQDAFQLILHTFQGDVRTAGQMLAAVANQEKLATAAGEVGLLIAAMQTVVGDDNLLAGVERQAAANAEVGNNPLSDAAGSSELSAANSPSIEAASASLAATGSV